MDTPTPGTECRTLTDAYSRFGIRISAPRTAWSAQADDGTVVVTLWASRYDAVTGVYDVLHDQPGAWEHQPANRSRMAHLKYALDHRGGEFESIIIFDDDPANKRIKRREIGPKMRLVDLRERGQFRAERVG